MDKIWYDKFFLLFGAGMMELSNTHAMLYLVFLCVHVNIQQNFTDHL